MYTVGNCYKFTGMTKKYYTNDFFSIDIIDDVKFLLTMLISP